MHTGSHIYGPNGWNHTVRITGVFFPVDIRIRANPHSFAALQL